MTKNKNAVEGGKAAVAVGSALKGMTHPIAVAIGSLLVIAGMGVQAHFDGDPETVVAWGESLVALIPVVMTVIAYFKQPPGKTG